MRRRLVLLGAIVLGLSGPAVAARTASPPLSAEDQALVARAVAYLESLSSMAGRFSQMGGRGPAASGDIHLQRPGRARFDYDPPSGLVIASDGRLVSVVDRRLKTVQSYPLGMTPLALFLARDIRLDRGVAVDRVVRGSDIFTVVARDGRRRNQGEIALDFSEKPLALLGWTVTDAGGGAVHVRLSNFVPSPPRDRSYFEVAPLGRPAPAR